MKKYLVFLICFLPIYPNSNKDVDVYVEIPVEVRLERKLDKLNNDLKTLEEILTIDEIR